MASHPTEASTYRWVSDDAEQVITWIKKHYDDPGYLICMLYRIEREGLGAEDALTGAFGAEVLVDSRKINTLPYMSVKSEEEAQNYYAQELIDDLFHNYRGPIEYEDFMYYFDLDGYSESLDEMAGVVTFEHAGVYYVLKLDVY